MERSRIQKYFNSSQTNNINLPEHLHWKLSGIIEIIESWRVIHTLLSRGYQKEKIKPLLPPMSDEYFDLIIDSFNQYGMVNIENVFMSIIEDYRKEELEYLLEKMIKHDFSLDDMKLVIPNTYHGELLSTED